MIESKQWMEIGVDKLVKADWNYKMEEDSESKELLEKLKENISRNGQIENLLIRELDGGMFEVTNGNHRYDALMDLKIKTAVVYNLGKITLAQAKRVAIETNETKFKADHVKLAEILKELEEEFGLSELAKSMPYNESEIANFTTLTELNCNEDDNKINGIVDHVEGNEFEKIELSVPSAVADQFWAQMDRFKKALYPGTKPSEVSPVMPFEAMVQVLAQTSEDQLI